MLKQYFLLVVFLCLHQLVWSQQAQGVGGGGQDGALLEAGEGDQVGRADGLGEKEGVIQLPAEGGSVDQLHDEGDGVVQLVDPPGRGGGVGQDCGGPGRQWGVWGGRWLTLQFSHPPHLLKISSTKPPCKKNQDLFAVLTAPLSQVRPLWRRVGSRQCGSSHKTWRGGSLVFVIFLSDPSPIIGNACH